MLTAFMIIAAVLPPALGCALLWRRERALSARLASLEGQARWYQDALRIAGAGVWQWNMRDNEWRWIENVFQPAGSSLRYSVEVGDEFYRYVHPDDRDRLLEVERHCRQGRPSMFDDYRYRLENGEERWLRDIGHVVSGRPGEPPTMIGITLDITGEKLRALEEEQRSLSDELTGLPNRRGLGEALDGMVAEGAAFCLGFVDLNGFKPLNDRFGHAAGDRCLVTLGEAFRAAARPGEIAARIGGDEFVLAVPLAEDGEAAAVERVKRLVRDALTAVERAMPEVRLGAAAGIALFPRDAADTAELLSLADRAMYQAKASGRHVAFRTHGGPSPDVRLRA